MPHADATRNPEMSSTDLVGLDGSSKEGLGPNIKKRPLGPPLGPRLGLGGGSKGFGAGGVGGRGTGPRDGANFATCLSNAYKNKKNDFFEGYPVGWGGVQGLGRGGPRASVPGG